MTRPLSWPQILASLPSPAQAYVQSLKGSGLAYSTTPYWSRVRLAPDTIAADGSNNTTYTFNAGHIVNPFQYGQGTQASGFAASLTAFNQATQAETNLQTARQTVDGALVVIQGVSLQLSPLSDPVMAAYLWPELSLTSGFGSLTSQYKHGVPAFMPGGASLTGAAPTSGQVPNAYDSFGMMGFTTNGMPFDEDERVTDDQICWFPQAQNSSESNFGMALYLNRAVSYVSPGRAAGIIATGGTAGTTPAIVPPITVGARGTYVDVMVKLKVVAIYPRTANS